MFNFKRERNIYSLTQTTYMWYRIERLYTALSVSVLPSCPLRVYTCNTRVIAPHQPYFLVATVSSVSLAAVGWHSFLARYKGDERRKGTTMTTFNYIFQCMCECVSAIKSLYIYNVYILECIPLRGGFLIVFPHK